MNKTISRGRTAECLVCGWRVESTSETWPGALAAAHEGEQCRKGRPCNTCGGPMEPDDEDRWRCRDRECISRRARKTLTEALS